MATPNELARVDDVPPNGLAIPVPTSGAVALPPAFGFTALPPEEPSLLWTVTKRYFGLLVVFAFLSAAAAAGVGLSYGKPTWLAEGELVYQAIPLTEAQGKVYTQRPTLGTLAGYAINKRLVGELLAEFASQTSIEDFLQKNLKVYQPERSEVIAISVMWPNRDQGVAMVNRHMERVAAAAVEMRKETILRLAVESARQEQAAAQAEERFWSEQVRDVQGRIAAGESIPATDPTILAHRDNLREMIRRDGENLRELRDQLPPKEIELKMLRDLAAKNVASRNELLKTETEVRQLKLKIAHAEAALKAHDDDLRNLPVRVAETERSRFAMKVRKSTDDVRQLEELAKSAREGNIPARGFLQGMDARELVVKSEAEPSDQPVTSNKKQVAAITFMLLMAASFGLLLVYDRIAHPPTVTVAAPTSETAPVPVRASVVKVSRRDGGTSEVTIARVEADRLGTRIDHWLKGPESTGETSLTLGPDGKPMDPPGGGDDPAHLAMRIQQWLEKY
ncbi:MAG: hypothetical protein U0746_09265 [Gemmataceae bacterium]